MVCGQTGNFNGKNKKHEISFLCPVKTQKLSNILETQQHELVYESNWL